MKKLFKKLALMVVALLTFSVGSNYTVKEVKAAGTGSYVKVTETPTDWSGRYLFATIKDNVTYVFNLEDAANGYYGIESSDSSISSTDVSSYEITIEKYSTGYSLKTSKGYMYGTSGSNKLNFDASSAQVNTLTFFDSDDTVKIVSNTSVFTFNSAANNLRYRYYKSTTAKDDSTTYLRPSLFKFVENSSEGETPVPSISLDVPTKSLYVGNAGGSNTTTITATINDSDLTELKWESSNENVATVSQDGVVTAVSSGETTIKTSLVGTEIFKETTITVFDYTTVANVDDYLLLNVSSQSGLTSSSSDVLFTSEEVNYYGTKVYTYNGCIAFAKDLSSSFYNLNPYSKSIKQIVIEQQNSVNNNLNIDVYGSSSLNNLKEFSSVYEDKVIFDTETNTNKTVRIYSFDSNDVKHFYIISNNASYYTNMKNIWVEFVERYTVTFDVNGGDALSNSVYNVRKGETISVSNPTRNGYVFKGWKNGETTLSSDSLTVNETATYVAQWQVDLSTVETKAQLDFGYNYSVTTGEATSTVSYAGTTTNMTNDNQASLLGLDENCWDVTANQGKASNMPGLNKDGDIRLYWNAEGSNTISFTYAGGNIKSIIITYTGINYSNGIITVNDNEIEAVDNEYTINSNTFSITNGNTENVQVRIKSINIVHDADVYTYDTFKNVNLRYSASIPTNLFADVESFGFNIAVGSNNMDYPVEKTTVVGENTTFALVLTNITDYKSVITVTGYVVIDGERINLGSKSHSVESMIQYYLDYSSSLGLSANQIEVLTAFSEEIA